MIYVIRSCVLPTSLIKKKAVMSSVRIEEIKEFYGQGVVTSINLITKTLNVIMLIIMTLDKGGCSIPEIKGEKSMLLCFAA